MWGGGREGESEVVQIGHEILVGGEVLNGGDGGGGGVEGHASSSAESPSPLPSPAPDASILSMLVCMEGKEYV